ncbi:hypothetical protein Bca4012_059117 [Brassica carinata]|uniref:Uncharacterized protein n=1 Tax=Brassica carinata TaxID=52824 RepID=A0A8X8B6X6_BRACI|nr:hypothetical protein Bca52824_016860 [Brassica carinata]
MLSHIEDGDKELKKPVLFTEFGLSNLNKDNEPSQRDQFYRTIFDVVYKSAKRKRTSSSGQEVETNISHRPCEIQFF